MFADSGKKKRSKNSNKHIYMRKKDIMFVLFIHTHKHAYKHTASSVTGKWLQYTKKKKHTSCNLVCSFKLYCWAKRAPSNNRKKKNKSEII